MQKITDIWFKTELKLEKLANKLKLEDISYDYENIFEWAIAKLDGQELNISRAHLDFVAIAKETNVSLSHKKPPKKDYPETIRRALVSKLKDIGISPVFLGEMTVNDKDENVIINLVEEIK